AGDSTPSAVALAKTPDPVPAPRSPGGEDHDALLRRLRELGELYQAGVLTDEEFTAAKKAVLGRF
ncbi:Tat pathway signal sequence domain protein, partial [Streptomyces sp. SID5475]|nr:Tat pathway signal sequence domain protein [Streptomyces sp. SID5475]